MTDLKKQMPSGWGSDSITDFIERARRNEYATFANIKKPYARLRDINDTFLSLCDINQTEVPIQSLLLLRTHSSYLAAVRLSMGGQVAEVYPLLRSSIEASLYALHMFINPNTETIWVNRHKDELSLKTCRVNFNFSKVFATLEAEDINLALKIKTIYQNMIDFGGHPNELSIMSNIEVKKDDFASTYSLVYLTGHSKPLLLALTMSARVGICTLMIFQHIFKTRYNLLGLTEKIKQLQKGL